MKPRTDPYRILVVEDDPINLALARRILTGAGYAVMGAADGRSAHEVLADYRVDLMLLDLILPDCNGIDIARAVRAQPDGESLPIIAVSAHFDPLDEARGSELGFINFLDKPIDAGLLLRMVDDLLPEKSETLVEQRSGLRIVLADDNPTMRGLVEIYLERVGFVVETAGDGRIALELCRRRPPDAIVSDAMMPNLDGFQFCHEVRRDPTLASIPFVLVSSHYLEEEDRELGRRVGINKYVMRGEDSSLIVQALLDALDSPVPLAPESITDDVFSEHSARVFQQLERQVKMNETLTARCSFQRTLLAVSAAISESIAHVMERPKIFEAALSCLLSANKFVAALGFLVDENGKLCFANAVGQFESKDAEQLYGRLELAERALDDNEILVLPNPMSGDSDRNLLLKFRTGTVVVVPLSSPKGDRFGAIVLAVKANDLDAETSAFLRTLRQELVRALCLVESEERLLHAQKIDAIGEVSGTVAHDFNNILSAIIGFGELALDECEENDPRREDIGEVLKAATRGSLITSQLLTFSRRQFVSPGVLRADVVIENLLPLLHNLIREEITIETQLNSGQDNILIDTGQFEQALVNLVVNARDAIEESGTIAIRTAAIELDQDNHLLGPTQSPGRFLVITVADTGRGMSETTKTRALEPFFSTKQAGHGTGLGLPTVATILRRYDGHLTLESEVDKGTVTHLTFPVTTERLLATSANVASPVDSKRYTETILIVEDEPSLLKMLIRLVEQQGYRTLSATHAKEALSQAAQETGPIHLLITDVVMPHMRGGDLAAQLRTTQPDLPVLFISGYTAGVLSEKDLTTGITRFLNKPFDSKKFLTLIRQILDESESSST